MTYCYTIKEWPEPPVLTWCGYQYMVIIGLEITPEAEHFYIGEIDLISPPYWHGLFYKPILVGGREAFYIYHEYWDVDNIFPGGIVLYFIWANWRTSLLIKLYIWLKKSTHWFLEFVDYRSW